MSEMTETAGTTTHDEFCSLRTTTDYQWDNILGPSGKKLSQAFDNLLSDTSTISGIADNTNTPGSSIVEVVETASRYLRDYTETHQTFVFPNTYKGWPGEPNLPHELAKTSMGEKFYLELAEENRKENYCTVCEAMDDQSLKASANESLSVLTTYMANQGDELNSKLKYKLGELDEAERSTLYELARKDLGQGLPSGTRLERHLTDLETSATLSQTIPYPIALAKSLTGLE